MKRRKFLVLAGGFLTGGCLSSRAVNDGGPPPERELREIRVSTPESRPLSITADITNSRITPDQQAQFEIKLTWNGEESQSFGFGNEIPFTEPYYSTSPKGLLLFTPNSGLNRRNENTWLPKTGDDDTLSVKQNAVTGKFHSGDSVSKAWSVWGDPRYLSYIESGTYEFNNSIDVLSSNADNTDQFIWTMEAIIKKR